MAENNRGKYHRTAAHKKRLSEGRKLYWSTISPEKRSQMMKELIAKRVFNRISTSVIDKP